MTFVRLSTILDGKQRNHPALREAAALALLKRAWETYGLKCFHPSARPHLRRTVRLRSFAKGTLRIETADAQTAAMLTVKREELLRCLKEHCGELGLTSLDIRS